MYTSFLQAQREHFAPVASSPLFTTNSTGLWPAFLAALPENERQHHTCRSCQTFVERFGDLVTIDSTGHTSPAMWGAAPDFYAPAFAVLRKLVSSSKVTGVFLSSEKTLGTPVTGEWQHMAVSPDKARVFHATALKTASQAMAEKREEFGMLCRGLAEFGPEVVAQALTIVQANALYRVEKVEGVVKWLSELHAARSRRGVVRDNVTWLAVASAPAGFCHVKSTMVGTLLEDIAAGLEFGEIKRRFAEKMDPTKYLRPQAAPKAGNIAQAEKVVAELGAAGALRRRFARLDEVVALWRTGGDLAAAAEGGVFSHLAPKSKALDVRAPSMSWAKFRDTVLPTATKIDFLVPSGHHSFVALLTAADPAAPLIFQWDNPVSYYVYAGGSPALRWNLMAGKWAAVTAVALKPSQWDSERTYSHFGEGAFFVLDGAVDTETGQGNAIFPENLRSEFHGIRATIEAYSRSAEIEGREGASACGWMMIKGSERGFACEVRVTTKSTGPIVYTLDRWD